VYSASSATIEEVQISVFDPNQYIYGGSDVYFNIYFATCSADSQITLNPDNGSPLETVSFLNADATSDQTYFFQTVAITPSYTWTDPGGLFAVVQSRVDTEGTFIGGGSLQVQIVLKYSIPTLSLSVPPLLTAPPASSPAVDEVLPASEAEAGVEETPTPAGLTELLQFLQQAATSGAS